MGDLRGILNTNITDAGGTLSEEELLKTVNALMSQPKPERQGFITSTLTLRRAHADIERWEKAADAAKMDVYRLRRGWRRVRFIARRRAAERYLDNRIAADALAAKFGRRA
jgi:hypothetical protein